jgi:hypothetical protein
MCKKLINNHTQIRSYFATSNSPIHFTLKKLQTKHNSITLKSALVRPHVIES